MLKVEASFLYVLEYLQSYIKYHSFSHFNKLVKDSYIETNRLEIIYMVLKYVSVHITIKKVFYI